MSTDFFKEIESNFPSDYLIDNDFETNVQLEELIVYYMYSYSKYIDLKELFDFFIRMAEVYKEHLDLKDYVILLPGDSPTLFWYIMTVLYPEVKELQIKRFPISSVKNLTQRQSNIIDSYLEEILFDIDRSNNIAYFDFKFSGKSEEIFQKSLKKLGFSNDIKLMNIHSTLNDPRCRSTISFPPDEIEKYLETGIMKKHNYTRYNILMYLFKHYFSNKKLFEDISWEAKIKKPFSWDEQLNPFVSKKVFVEYISLNNDIVEVVEISGILTINYDTIYIDGKYLFSINNIISIDKID